MSALALKPVPPRVALDVKTTIQAVSFTIDWTIEHFSTIKTHDISLPSPSVSCQDLGLHRSTGEWSLQLHPVSYEDLRTLKLVVGLYLHRSGELADSVHARCDFTVPSSRHTKVFEHIFPPSTTDALSSKFVFIYHKCLLDPSKNFLVDDKLTIHAEIQLISGRGITTTTLSKFPTRNDTLSLDYANLRSEFGAKTADFVFIASDGSRFPVHRVVLSARCPAFAAMLKHQAFGESKTGRCTIEDIDGPTLDVLLDFIYSGIIAKLPETAEKLLIAAEKYSLLVLKDKCEGYLMEHISSSNAARLLELADQHNADRLKAAILGYSYRPLNWIF